MKEPKTVIATLLSLVVIATGIVSCGRKDQKSTVDSQTLREQTVQKPETAAGPGKVKETTMGSHLKS